MAIPTKNFFCALVFLLFFVKAEATALGVAASAIDSVVTNARKAFEFVYHANSQREETQRLFSIMQSIREGIDFHNETLQINFEQTNLSIALNDVERQYQLVVQDIFSSSSYIVDRYKFYDKLPIPDYTSVKDVKRYVRWSMNIFVDIANTTSPWFTDAAVVSKSISTILTTLEPLFRSAQMRLTAVCIQEQQRLLEKIEKCHRRISDSNACVAASVFCPNLHAAKSLAERQLPLYHDTLKRLSLFKNQSDEFYSSYIRRVHSVHNNTELQDFVLKKFEVDFQTAQKVLRDIKDIFLVETSDEVMLDMKLLCPELKNGLIKLKTASETFLANLHKNKKKRQIGESNILSKKKLLQMILRIRR